MNRHTQKFIISAFIVYIHIILLITKFWSTENHRKLPLKLKKLIFPLWGPRSWWQRLCRARSQFPLTTTGLHMFSIIIRGSIEDEDIQISSDIYDTFQSNISSVLDGGQQFSQLDITFISSYKLHCTHHLLPFFKIDFIFLHGLHEFVLWIMIETITFYKKTRLH